jgi:hypothetical protein
MVAGESALGPRLPLAAVLAYKGARLAAAVAVLVLAAQLRNPSFEHFNHRNGYYLKMPARQQESGEDGRYGHSALPAGGWA